MSDVLRAALIACMAELELAPEDKGVCGEYPELCTACKAYDQVRAAIASDAGSVGALPTWEPTRELRIESGPVVISQTRTDPGDMGEPRVLTSDGVTYVAVPDFEGAWSVGALDVERLARAVEVAMWRATGASSLIPEYHDYTEAMGWQLNWNRVAAAIAAAYDAAGEGER